MRRQHVKPGVRNSARLNWGSLDGYHAAHCVTTVSDDRVPRVGDRPVAAVIATWNDADIIGMNIRALRAQGVNYIATLDNDSVDDSVAIARSLGVEHVRVWHSQIHEDAKRTRLQSEIARDIVKELGNCWMIQLDADEIMPSTPRFNLRQFLASQPYDVRTIGADNFEFFPMPGQRYDSAATIEEIYTHGVLRNGAFCRRLHWKHQITRYDNGVFDACLSRGLHYPATLTGQDFVESRETLTMLHVQYRDEAIMRWRLGLLCGTDRDREDNDVCNDGGAKFRWQQLGRVYAHDYASVELSHPWVYGRRVKGLALYKWADRKPVN